MEIEQIETAVRDTLGDLDEWLDHPIPEALKTLIREIRGNVDAYMRETFPLIPPGEATPAEIANALVKYVGRFNEPDSDKIAGLAIAKYVIVKRLLDNENGQGTVTDPAAGFHGYNVIKAKAAADLRPVIRFGPIMPED